MTGGQDISKKDGLKFFGMMTAAVSHELKNVLAILNENAGLIQDLLLMAEKGGTVNMERLAAVAGRFGAQISRGDNILKNLNWFSHTVDRDEPIETNICEALRQAAALTERFASMRGVTVDLDQLPQSILSTTRPFSLAHLFWLGLDYAMDAAGASKRVVILCHPAGSRVNIVFSELGGNMDIPDKPLFLEQGTRLAQMLNADIDIQADDRCLMVTI